MAEKKNGDILYADDFNGKQDKIGTLTTHEFESGGIARYLQLGSHTEDYLYIQGGDFVVDKFVVPTGIGSSFNVGANTAAFDHNVRVLENVSVGESLVVSNIKSSDSGSTVLNIGGGSVHISNANALVFDDDGASINHVSYIAGNGNSLWMFAGSPGSSSFVNINNEEYVKIGNYNSGQQPIPLLGISTPISSADTTLGITADDLPYQAANKKYVDDKIAELTAKIEALSK